MQFLKILPFIKLALLSYAQAPITQRRLGADPFVGINLPNNAFGATILAYLYGSPLLGWDSVLRGGAILPTYGTNKIHNAGGLVGGGNFGFVDANTDTVYAQAFVDLAATDLILTVPPMQSDRYYSYSFFDPFSDDFAVISTVNNDPSGDYLISPSIKTDVARKIQNCTGYVGCINSPTKNFLLLVRVLAIPGNQTDIDYVTGYIDNIKLTGTNHHKPTAPALSQRDFDGLSSNSNVTRALQLLARFTDRNPPQDPLLATFLPFVLQAAGISNGNYTPTTSADVSQIDKVWQRITQAFIASSVNLIQLTNGWNVNAPFWCGTFENGTNIVARAFISTFGYLQNTAEQSLYFPGPQGTYTLDEGEAYLLTFSGKPPLKQVGFWSITIYHFNSSALITNPYNIHSVSDRSNLTYPDGTLVYGAENSDRDDPFQVLIQPYDQPPPSNWTNK